MVFEKIAKIAQTERGRRNEFADSCGVESVRPRSAQRSPDPPREHGAARDRLKRCLLLQRNEPLASGDWLFLRIPRRHRHRLAIRSDPKHFAARLARKAHASANAEVPFVLIPMSRNPACGAATDLEKSPAARTPLAVPIGRNRPCDMACYPDANIIIPLNGCVIDFVCQFAIKFCHRGNAPARVTDGGTLAARPSGNTGWGTDGPGTRGLNFCH